MIPSLIVGLEIRIELPHSPPTSARKPTTRNATNGWCASRAVGRDVGPFFDLWGVPVSDAAKESIAGLPG
jgi:hypothetical protein